MFVFWLVYVAIVIRASPHNHGRDNLFMQGLTGEDWSFPDEPASTNIFNDNTFLSSATPSDDDLTEDLFFNPADELSFGALDLGQDSDLTEIPPMEGNFDPLLLGVNGEGEESLFGDIALTSDNYHEEEGFPIDIWDSSISTAPCNSQGGPSGGSFDSSASTTLPDLDGSPELIAGDDLNPESLDAARRRPNWRYTIEPVYELGPDIGPTVDASDAYAADGTAIKPNRCPKSTKKSCCTDNTHTACWRYPLNIQLCRYARNLYCCAEISQPGGPGVGCQTIEWVYERTRPRKKPPSNPPNQLQGIFDIFQFPDLNPSSNPSYCPSPNRF